LDSFFDTITIFNTIRDKVKVDFKLKKRMEKIVDDEVAPLLDSRTVAGVVVEVGELRIGVVKGPLDEVVGQIVAPIVVRTVLKVNDNEIRLIVGCEAGIQRRVIRGIQFRAGRRRYAVRFAICNTKSLWIWLVFRVHRSKRMSRITCILFCFGQQVYCILTSRHTFFKLKSRPQQIGAI